MKVLVVNCGSSSIKYQFYQMPEKRVISKGLVERIGEESGAIQHHYADEVRRLEGQIADHEEGMALILETLSGGEGVLGPEEEIDAIGHRVVHGGEEFTGSVLITPEVIASIERFSDLAPLHNPPNLTGIRAAMHELPDVPQVACFDTAFHATIPQVAYTYALPYPLYEKFGIRRYGFHGTSHRYVARRAAQMLGLGKYEIDCITVHLGNGCSMTAVQHGRSVDTSMGLTPLEGLVMGTRTGDFDPAILFYLADRGYDLSSLNKLCNKQSGLLGISGRSNDMRMLLGLSREGDRRAALAIDVFSTGSRNTSACTRRCSAASMPWFSPGASAKTPSRSAPRPVTAWTAWVLPSIRRSTSKWSGGAKEPSARRRAERRSWSSPPTKKRRLPTTPTRS